MSFEIFLREWLWVMAPGTF